MKTLHNQAHTSRKPWRFLIYLLLSTTLIPTAVAPASPESCSSVTAVGTAAGTQTTVAAVNNNVGAADCDSNSDIVSIPAGSPFTIYCTQSGSDTTVLEPTAITINLVVDNTNFGSNTPTSVRSIDATSCINGIGVTFSAACTTTGSAGGAAAYGLLRIHIRMTRTGTATYDVNSDDAGTPPLTGDVDGYWGVIRCEAGATAISQSNPQTTYVANDLIGTSLTVNATPYTASNNGNFWVTCGTTSYNLGNSFPTTTAKSLSTTIIGSLNLWQDDCTAISFGFQFTLFSSISGWTATRRTVFNGTPPSGSSFNAGKDNITLATSATLDRTISTFGTCHYHLNASGTIITAFERLEGVRADCTWQNARGVTVPNNRPARAYYSTSTLPDTTAYASTDLLVGGGGLMEWTKQSSITAAPGTYHGIVHTFSTTARTTAELLSIGNMTDTFTLTMDRHWTDIQLWSVTPGGTNQSSFTAGDDQLFTSARGLKNVRGETLQTVNATCRRIFPSSGTESETPMGNTDASGNTPFVEFGVTPPLGQYHMVCSSEAAGNFARYDVTYFVTSAFTGNTVVVIETWRQDNRLTIAGGVHSITDEGLEENIFDNPNEVYYHVLGRQDDGYPFFHIGEGLLTQSGSTPVWTANVTLPSNGTKYIHIHVYGNFAGNTLIGARELEQWNSTTLSGNFTGNYTILEADGMIETSNPTLLWTIWTLIWFGALILFMWRGAILPLIPTIIELFIRLISEGKGVDRLWSMEFSLVLLVVMLLVHLLLNLRGFMRRAMTPDTEESS